MDQDPGHALIVKQELLKDHILKGGTFYTSLFENHPDAVFAVDLEGNCMLANSACEMLTGYPIDEFLQLTIMQFLPFEREHFQSEQRINRFQQALLGHSQKYETTMRCKSGDPIDVYVTLVPITIEEEVLGVLGLAKDITERKQTEEQLRKTKALFDLLTENTQDLISYSTPLGVTQYISSSVTTKLGYEIEEVIGKPTTNYWHPDDIERLAKQTFSDSDIFECRIRHKLGHYLWFETTFKKIRNQEGQAELVVGVGRDITLRKMTEVDLVQTKEQLDFFVEHHVDGIVFFDLNGKLVRANQQYERLFGWTAEELKGLDLHTLPNIPEDLRQEAQENLNWLYDRQIIVGRETRRVRKDGSELYVLLSAFPIRLPNGEVMGWSCVMRDITQQKKAEDLMLQTEKLSVVGQLAAGIAHEIRNPLTALKGFTHLFKIGDCQNTSYLEIMEAEIQRIEAILTELLVLAKPQIDSNTTELDMADVVQDVISLMQPEANLFNTQFQFSNHTTDSIIKGDRNEIKQIFINFIKNSIEAMPNGGTIAIELTNFANSISIRFIDQGIGISPERLKRIGEPFYTTKEKGTGLGMMVSKKIIENHDGEIYIHSEQNKGTTIELKFPLIVE